jgi:acyl-CoA thioester hydrolase
VADQERRADYGYWLELSSRWADCDAYGHVNSPVYYSWFDTALTTLLIERGVLRSPESPSIGLCVESHCRFLAPVEFPETVDARVRIGKLGDKSLRYELALFRRGGDEVVAAGWFVHVFVDPVTRRPVSLTDRQKQAVADLCRSV